MISNHRRAKKNKIKNIYEYQQWQREQNEKAIKHELMEQIKKQIEFVKKIKAIYSEVVIILDNGGISNQISNIENNFKKIIKSFYAPFFLIISPQYINLTNFISSKTFQYKLSFNDIFKYKNEENEKKEKKNKLEKEKENEEEK